MDAVTEKLLKTVSDVSGETVEDILSRRRRRPLPVCRWLVASELVRRGYSINYASGMVNITHATLLHGRVMLDIMKQHPQHTFAEEVHIEKAFRSALAGSE